MISRNTWSYGGNPAWAFGADGDVARATATANPALAIRCLETRCVQLLITGSFLSFTTSTLPTGRNARVIAISNKWKLAICFSLLSHDAAWTSVHKPPGLSYNPRAPTTRVW